MATKYKANGIPHLVIVNGVTGEVITFDGTSEVGEDADGLKFPWYPKTLKEIWTPEIQILGVKTSGNKTVEYSSLKDKYLMLYFSAHWCPPCQEFTPILSEAYTKLKSERDDFELVFVSSDRDKSAFNDYFKEMTFCALPFEHRDTKATGEVITFDGTSEVGQDADGAQLTVAKDIVSLVTMMAAVIVTVVVIP
eukprot:CAMPEP_0194450090 /NCGR_PEP_ID=MMETSP0176-20130528/130511_1 /TAXON_ID=216777 /ORGANISM="Proboscia alata, Strain PI-D3" /LENGTH=193 /DNA_ID=CAMNT_0039277307 /DNA_START=21 /DNA_END=602 /DNA_ORIENTATION=+